MKARLTCLSGIGGKGPACFLVEAEGLRLMLDLGVGPTPGEFPPVDGVGKVDALLLSHQHGDHIGALSLRPRIGLPTIHATPPVAQAAALAEADYVPLPLRGRCEVAGIGVSTGRSGHSPGGIWLHLAVGDGLLYCGDISCESALFPFDPPPPATTVLLDASYGIDDVPQSTRAAAVLAELAAGPVLLPVPAAGRGAEIALMLHDAGAPLPRLDAKVRTAIAALAKGDGMVTPSVAVRLARIAENAPEAGPAEGVTLASDANAMDGMARELALAWAEAPNGPAILFTGYIPPGTLADQLIREGRARWMRWNVHPTLSDNRRLVRATGARRVIPAFGPAKYLDDWKTAFAPAEVTLQKVVEL
ncbi:MBL fold metallo-hydrolase [Telmatospirillum sp. J64-1]|uniref:MBL fold metallo-hydrolase n=1 Tax=Telmatospirillum sp. J64-1 TaxID=2502183 RepID=UPI00115D2E47|nr:MBL fold metallo-hydrolase [Telmatospirillum sp. J64-1]